MEPIPTPLSRRAKEWAARLLPPTLFAAALLFVVLMWNQRMGPDTLPGEVDSLRVTLAAPAAGTVLEMGVRDLQMVKAGEILGRVLVGDSKTIVDLRAPFDGRTGLVSVSPGEAVTAGQSLITLAAPRGDRIICYLRQPLSVKVSTNQVALIRARSLGRHQGQSYVMQVGHELLPIRKTLLPPTHERQELGLPVLIALPEGLELLPGELVDVTFKEGTAAPRPEPPRVAPGNSTQPSNATAPRLEPNATAGNATKAK